MSEECKVEEEDEVVLRVAGAVVIFTGEKRVKLAWHCLKEQRAHVKKALLCWT
jgi:hypothetical protein